MPRNFKKQNMDGRSLGCKADTESKQKAEKSTGRRASKLGQSVGKPAMRGGGGCSLNESREIKAPGRGLENGGGGALSLGEPPAQAQACV